MVPDGLRWSQIDKMVAVSLLWRFCSFYMCVLRLCFWGSLTLPCLHEVLHLVILGEIPLKQSRRSLVAEVLLFL